LTFRTGLYPNIMPRTTLERPGFTHGCPATTYKEKIVPSFELAQLNIARLIAPIDSPKLAEFVANLDRINALAERSPGFVWRLQGDDGDATAIRNFGPDMLVNMSVWKDVGALHGYVYKSAHVEIMRRRKEWFELMREMYTVLWWVPENHRPSLEEAEARLTQLREYGPTSEAFTFKKAFPAPGNRSQARPTEFTESCPAC